VEKVARKFRSFAEVGKADREFYHSLTPEQRLDILGELFASANSGANGQRIEKVGRIIKLQED
jgi:Spy/CpxP family protein refolding chaperone